MSIPNLDTMNMDQLAGFYRRHRLHTTELVPGDLMAARRLVRYAEAKLAALRCRKDGHEQGAQACERECARIYSALPSSIRW